MRSILAKFILVNRWLAAVFLVGLTVALGLFAARFITKVVKFGANVFQSQEDQALLDLLHLLDWTLVASLVVMVILASWDSLVSPFDPASRAGGMSWIRKLDPGNLKVKLAGSIVAISSIQLLQMFLRGDGYSDRAIGWAMGLHALFLVGAVALALTDRISAGSRPADKNETPEP
ncbi:YqhA family protein [Neoroseomonas lacus]|uniref:UPF0114 protein GCM10011320_05350 n=1 Tax=Neoroseomonas lacus TaxID=287609 RepID=A0A917NHP5_9PROT|nr:YqhA family protein [Neoroseomonas lacus]GGJ01424.1 UPF0114 protein [Neoroseomonas lacus]